LVAAPAHADGAGTLVEGGTPLVSAQSYDTGAYWYIEQGQRSIGVIPGALRADPTQGVVIVIATRGSERGGIYETPTKAGKLKIVSAQGEQLTLQAKDGSMFTFDLPTRSLRAK
jgi:hypothetical protein